MTSSLLTLSQDLVELVQAVEDYSKMHNEPKELELIQKIKELVKRSHPSTILPIGDDGFVYKSFSQNTALVQDMLVESVHFDLSYFSLADIGWKSLAVNLSDLAAIGAKPFFAQVSLAVPSKIDSNQILDFYKGMLELADQHQVEIIGGDLSKSPGPLVIDVSVAGEVKEPVTRNLARNGDQLFVTGPLGLSATGLAAFKTNSTGYSKSKSAHLRPRPRLDCLPLMSPSYCRAAIDVSDGLVNEVMHLCRKNRLGVRLWSEKIPIDIETQTWDQSPDILRDSALWGGEDFELLIAVGPVQKSLFESESNRLGLKCFHIGEFNSSGEIEIQSADGQIKLVQDFKGWKHF